VLVPSLGVKKIQVVGLVLSIVGLGPIVGAVYYWVLRYTAARRMLRLTLRGPIDFVVTTSTVHTSSPAQGPGIRRPLTGVGQVQGVAFGSKAIGELYRRKEIRVHLSVEVRDRLDEDMLLLGGPVRNKVTRQALELLNASRATTILFDDVHGKIRLPAKGLAIDMEIDVSLMARVPEQDIGLALFASNPFTDKPRRFILCCGITSYGTAAISEYLFEVILANKYLVPRDIRRVARLGGIYGFVARVSMSSGRAVMFYDIRWFEC